jgi:hypothetical protein
MDQLQVELRIKAMQPVLIPDPLCSIARRNDVVQVAMDLGSELV